MNMNDVDTLYSTMYDTLNEFLLLSAEMKEIIMLLSFLSETLETEDYKHFKNDPVAVSLRSAVLHALRVTNDFDKLDEPTGRLIKQFHTYLTSADRTVQKGA